MKRKAISKKLRFDIFKRDEFTCQYCGSSPPEIVLEIDHVIAVSMGGGDDETNLVTSCFDCNRGKSNKSLSMAPKSLAARAEELKEREAQLAGYREVAERKLARIEADLWKIANILFPGEDTIWRDWARGIKMFNERLPHDEVVDSAELAIARFSYSDRQRFLYFCGICWRKIKERRGQQ